jgi:restriction endonuclease
VRQSERRAAAGFEVNTLTVIANESYEQFAENLQKDIEQDAGIRFGVVHDHEFAGIPVTLEGGVVSPLGFEASKALGATSRRRATSTMWARAAARCRMRCEPR